MDRRTRPVGHPELDGYLSDARLIERVPVERTRSLDPREGGQAATADDAARLDVWLTGTGTPAALPGRSGPSTLLRCRDDVVLVDCGNGTAYQLARLGLDPRQVTHVFITHHHLDHNVDLPFLILSPWIQNRETYEPPVVIGPPGTGAFVERMFLLHEYDLRVRKFHGYQAKRAVPSVVEVTDGGVVHGDGWSCTAFAVDHYPVESAFGYAFRAGDKTVVISGDTQVSENLVRHAAEADLLIHEAIFEGYGYPDYHTLAADVGKVAAAAHVKQLALTHLIPGDLPDEAWLREVRYAYDGPTVVGHDLQKVL
jgi:ribonuclease Z